MDLVSIDQAGSGGGVELRLFAALHVPTEPGNRLAKLGERVAMRHVGVRAIAPDDLHVTFAFLGNVAEEYVPAIALGIDDAARSIPGPVACSTRGPRAFGDGRVLRIDVDLDLLPLLAAARDRFIEDVRPYAPHADRRPWHPHVSIARGPAGIDLVGAMRSVTGEVGDLTWVTPQLRLYASLPAPTCTMHRLLHEVPFGIPVEQA